MHEETVEMNVSLKENEMEGNYTVPIVTAAMGILMGLMVAVSVPTNPLAGGFAGLWMATVGFWLASLFWPRRKRSE